MSVNGISTLKSKKSEILELWMKNQLADPGLTGDLISNQELRTQSAELVNALVNNLNVNNINDSQSSDFDQVTELLGGISISRARLGFSPRETGFFILSLKEALLEILKKESTNASQLVEESLKLSRLLDNFTILTFETFIRGREEVIMRQTDEITDISTPVIKVWDGILALPIIGTLDSARTQIVMENLLQEIVNTGSGIAILDISGVPTVDSLVAQNLLKAVSATRLMGGRLYH